MICQHCGAGIPDDVNFCAYCGTPLVPQAPSHSADSPVFPTPYRYKLSLNKLLEDTFELYKRNFGTMCLVGLVVIVGMCVFVPFNAAADFILEMERVAEDTVLLTMALVGKISLQILQTIFLWYIILGMIRQCLYLAKGGTGFQARMFFPPFRGFLKYAGLMLVTQCIILSIVLLFALPPAILFAVAYSAGAFADNNNVSAAIIIGTVTIGILCAVTGVCVMIWITTRLYLAPMFLVERDAGIGNAIRDAWRVSSGNVWMLILAMIVLTMGSMLGFCLCCVGIILTYAICMLGMALIYLQLTGQPNGLDYSPPFPGMPNAFSEIEP